MCYSNVSWHQTCKVLLHTSARLSEAHHTATLLSPRGKNHPLTLTKQATELLTAKQDFKTLYSYQGNFPSILRFVAGPCWEHIQLKQHTHRCHPCWYPRPESGAQVWAQWVRCKLVISFISAGKIKSNSSEVELPWCWCTWREHQAATAAALHQAWGELVRSSAKHSAGIKLWLWGEVHRRTLSGMAEYLSLAAGWVNELHPATPVTRCMHLCQPFRGFDTDNATLMVLWNTFIKIPGKLRGVFPMSLLLRWAGIIYQLTKGWWNLLVSVPL